MTLSPVAVVQVVGGLFNIVVVVGREVFVVVFRGGGV